MNDFILTKRNHYYLNRYTIYGERHSGTKLLQKIINANTTLKSTWDFGYKHFFGFTDPSLIIQENNTLFVCIVRNPYDWLLAFYKEPHHVPSHNRIPIGNFLFNEWYSVEDYEFDKTEIVLDRNFRSGHKYKNIFALRRHKIYYMRQVLPMLCNNLILLKYENLISNPIGIISSIKALLDDTQRKRTNNFYIKPQNKYECKPIVKSMIDYHIDWDIEHTIGYARLD